MTRIRKQMHRRAMRMHLMRDLEVQPSYPALRQTKLARYSIAFATSIVFSVGGLGICQKISDKADSEQLLDPAPAQPESDESSQQSRNANARVHASIEGRYPNMTREHLRLSGAMRIAIMEDDAELLSKCVQRGFKVNEPMIGDDWDLPDFGLHEAAAFGSTKCIKMLLDLDASVDVRDEHQQRPISRAKTDEVRKLLEKTPEEGAQELFDEIILQFSDDVIFIDSGNLAIAGVSLKSGKHRAKIYDLSEMKSDFTSQKNGEKGRSMDLKIEPSFSKMLKEYKIDVRLNSGPLSGNSAQGSATLVHGFWVIDLTSTSES